MSGFPLIPAAILALLYNLLPLIMRDTGGAMLVLLILLPMLTLIISGFVGVRRGFVWYWPILAGILFVPAIFLYMNCTAWVYAPGFALLALLGLWIGTLIKQGENKHE